MPSLQRNQRQQKGHSKTGSKREVINDALAQEMQRGEQRKESSTSTKISSSNVARIERKSD